MNKLKLGQVNLASESVDFWETIQPERTFARLLLYRRTIKSMQKGG